MNATSHFSANFFFCLAMLVSLENAQNAGAKELASPAAAAASSAATKKPPALALNVGGHAVKAEIAADDATRQQGLMYRKQLPKNDGMLFVFPELGYHAMWMKNCFIPISVAYTDETGKIISIHEMEPQTETAHQALGPARYALEMNGGWFTAHKIKAGDSIKGIEKAPKPS